ncbi:MAG: hypothetical protein A2X81_17795 [Desulfobacterales bacterium GWB2_56_26]|nr:MAG: hypothetical protein A2X81_17795 [Desulfobacterales bacterium GWB2_56_26]
MGLTFTEPEPGCYGKAGSFGFEKAHYEISKKIGETQLLPAVRVAALDTWIVADGFSCRTKIRDGTYRKAMHLAESIEEGLRLNHKGNAAIKRTETVRTENSTGDGQHRGQPRPGHRPGFCPAGCEALPGRPRKGTIGGGEA